jgi:hypothetical protein
MKDDNSGIMGVIQADPYNSEIRTLSRQNRITPILRTLSGNLLKLGACVWES